MSLKYICAGLSRTGTTSFHHAMEALGFSSLHYDTERLWDVVCGKNNNPSFRVYDDLDVICDLPAPIYLSELMNAYPEAKVVLTVRDTDGWWKSIHARFAGHPIKKVSPLGRFAMARGWSAWPGRRHDQSRMFKAAARTLAYGSSTPQAESYKRKYELFNQHVIDSVSPEKLLVMNICAGDGWEKLCPFVGCEIPTTPFPRSNKH